MDEPGCLDFQFILWEKYYSAFKHFVIRLANACDFLSASEKMFFIFSYIPGAEGIKG